MPNGNQTIGNTNPTSPDWGQALLNYANSGDTSQINALFGPSAGAGGTPVQYGAGASAPSGPTGAQNLISLISALGKNQQQNQGPPPPSLPGYGQPLYATDAQGNPTGKPAGYTNPTDLMGMLGAQALGRRDAQGNWVGMPYVRNPTPGQVDPNQNPQSGVATVGGALIGGPGTTAPQGPWSTQAGLFAANPRLAPSSGTGAGASGITPVMPANAAGYAGAAMPTASPWATAPAAPGIGAMGPPPAAHMTALADAGKALYSHFGGDPESATHADIADFHTKVTGMIANYTAGANPSAAGTAPPAANQPLKANSGGLVSGQGNGDTVPALLTPGEYVLNRQQTAQLFGGRAPIKMQSGGLVQDPNDNQPPEARRPRLVVTNPSQPPAAPDGQGQSSQSQGSQQQSGGGDLFSGLAKAAQTYANHAALNSGGASGGGYNTPGGYIGASPGPGQSGYMYPSQGAATAAGDVGTGVKAAGGLGSDQAQSALGGVASGLGQASKAIAASAPPWRMQESAPMPVSKTPDIELAQQQGQRPPKQQVDPATAAYYQQYFPYMS